MEKMETIMEENERKMELMATTLETFIKSTLAEKGEKPCNEEHEDKGKEEPCNKKEGNGKRAFPNACRIE